MLFVGAGGQSLLGAPFQHLPCAIWVHKVERRYCQLAEGTSLSHAHHLVWIAGDGKRGGRTCLSFDGDMLQYFLVTADPSFLSSQPLGGSLWVVQDLSVP